VEDLVRIGRGDERSRCLEGRLLRLEGDGDGRALNDERPRTRTARTPHTVRRTRTVRLLPGAALGASIRVREGRGARGHGEQQQEQDDRQDAHEGLLNVPLPEVRGRALIVEIVRSRQAKSRGFASRPLSRALPLTFPGRETSFDLFGAPVDVVICERSERDFPFTMNVGSSQ
jgi:hypothetical protein